LACQPYDATLRQGCPHWQPGEEPPGRDVCIGNQCERTHLCYNHGRGEARCAAFEHCPIVGLPKVTPDNQEALRTFDMLKSGLIRPLDPATTPARTLDRLAIVNSCVTRAENAMMKELSKRGQSGR
jgi:hypothetical protein